MTKNEDILPARCEIKIALCTLVMVFLSPFGEEKARVIVPQKLPPDINGDHNLKPFAFEQLKHEVETYRANIVPKFANASLNQENVSAQLELLEIRLGICKERQAGTHMLGSELTTGFLATVIQDCEDTIDDLRNAYEVSDTKPLEAVRDKLQTWLDELDRQHLPHPSYPTGPV